MLLLNLVDNNNSNLEQVLTPISLKRQVCSALRWSFSSEFDDFPSSPRCNLAPPSSQLSPSPLGLIIHVCMGGEYIIPSTSVFQIRIHIFYVYLIACCSQKRQIHVDTSFPESLIVIYKYTQNLLHNNIRLNIKWDILSYRRFRIDTNWD